MAFSPNLTDLLIISSILVFIISGTIVHPGAAHDPVILAFEKWIEDFDRVYTSYAEKQHRFEVFKANFYFIESMKDQTGLTYTVALNQFADLNITEFLEKYAHFTPQSKPTKSELLNFTSMLIPTSIDWCALGACTPVDNQGQSCDDWAFSAVAAIEGLNKIKTGQLLDLSEKELIDCCTSCTGCSAGNIDCAFNCVIKMGGILTSADYKNTCVSSIVPTVKLTGYQDIQSCNETALMYVVANQPVSVAIDASSSSFQFYSGGIYTGPCGTNLNHDMTVVGYGTLSGTNFWKLKNSWGTSWGESGFIRMKKDISQCSGLCGIALAASYPTM